MIRCDMGGAEVWQPVASAGGYSVSNLGRLRGPQGRVSARAPGIDGYVVASLGGGRARRTTMLHRLVAQAFVPNPGRLPRSTTSTATVPTIERLTSSGSLRRRMSKNKWRPAAEPTRGLLCS